jgi:hypothetical protein
LHWLERQAEDAKQSYFDFRELVLEKLTGAPESFIKQFDDAGKLEEAYIILHGLRQAFRDLAHYMPKPPEKVLKLEPFQVYDKAEEESYRPHRLLARFEVSIWLEKETLKIQTEGIEWFQPILDLTSEQMLRIRSCEDCQQIYGAKQNNSRTCSTRCGDALRQRESRERKKQALYEAQRRRVRRNQPRHKGK